MQIRTPPRRATPEAKAHNPFVHLFKTLGNPEVAPHIAPEPE